MRLLSLPSPKHRRGTYHTCLRGVRCAGAPVRLAAPLAQHCLRGSPVAAGRPVAREPLEEAGSGLPGALLRPAGEMEASAAWAPPGVTALVTQR